MKKIDPELRRALLEAEKKARSFAGENEKLIPNYRFFFLYNREVGVYGNRAGNPWKKSRREWIEENVQIQDTRGDLVPLHLNAAQRYLESVVLRLERRGKAVRVVILKARQEGMSTYIVSLAFELMLRHENVSIRIVAHSEGTANVQLRRAKVMLRKLTRSNGTPWNLHLIRSGQGVLEVAEPIFGSIEITSSRAPDPGHGETNQMVHMTETSRWRDAQRAAKGIEQTCHEVPGNFVFDETTANGNTGYFYEKFTRAWEKKKENGSFADVGWQPVFLPWYVHESYRMSHILGREMTEEEIEDVRSSLNVDEKLLLEKSYARRGAGIVTVDIDQIAWRRYCIREKCTGDTDVFHEQYPAYPEEAFLASGRSVFNAKQVKFQIMNHQKPPGQRGEIIWGDAGLKAPMFAERADGGLRVWEKPIPGCNYAIGVDTSAGTRSSDPCCAMVIEMETQRIAAELHGRWEPPIFGPMIAALGWYYFEAYVGIETHPSPHGISVYDKCEDCGYSNLYVERKAELRMYSDSSRKGFSTSDANKAVLVDRIKSNVIEDVPIYSAGLLREMLNAAFDDRGKIHRKCQNDRIMAYGIALRIRDVAYIEGFVEIAKPPVLDETARFWKEWRPEESDEPTSFEEELFNGIE